MNKDVVEEISFQPDQYRFAAEYAPVHMIFTDAAGIIVYANPAAEMITGYSRREMIGKPLRMWGGEMPKEFYDQMWQKISVEKIPFNGELLQKRMNGDSYTAEIWMTPVLVGAEISGFVGVEIDVSDRKKLLSSLEESERRFRQMTDNIKEVFFLSDPKTFELFYISPSFEALWGIPVKTIYENSKLWFGAINEEDRPLVAASIQDVINGKESVSNFRINRPDGSTRLIHARSYPVFDAQGVPYRLAGFAEDVTANAENKELIRVSAENYRSLFKNMQFGFSSCRMIFVDGKPQDFIFLEVNDAFGTLTGLKDVVGKKISEVVPGILTTNPELIAAYGRVVSTGTPERMESHIEALGAWFSVSSYRSSPDSFVAVLDNITEIKNEQRRQQLFGNLVDQSGDGIEVADPETLRFIEVNEKTCHDLGYTREELLAMTIYDITPGLTKEFVAAGNKSLTETGSMTIEAEHRRKDGTIYPVEVHMRLIKLDRPYLVTAVRDITERKINEAKLKELDSLKNKFIDIVAHQLRTPLTAVRWNLETLLNGEIAKLKPENEPLVRVSFEATNEVIKRVSDLLTALDIEEGNVHIVKEEVDIESLVSGVIKESGKRCESRSIVCRALWGALDLPSLKLDAVKFRIALTKVMDNAVHYTQAGGTIDVQIRKVNGRLRIEFIDNGIGIPKTEQKKIFTRFYRASNAPVVHPDASGLGLYIAKFYIEAHGGTIGFESEEGKGSTFWIELPIT